MSSTTIQADFFTTNGEIVPISPNSRNSLSSTNSYVGNQTQAPTQSINSYSTISAPSLNKIPSLPPPNSSSKAGTLSSTSTSSSISSSLFNSIATSSPMSTIPQQNFGYPNTMNTARPSLDTTSSLNNLYLSNKNFNSQFNSVSLNSSLSNNNTPNVNTTKSQPIFNSGSILQPISSSNKSGSNNNSGTNQKISKGDLTMFDPYS